MVVFDTSFLTLMFVPTAKHTSPDARARIDHLLGDLSGRGDQIVVPTPVLSELLIKTGKARNAIIKELTQNPRWILAPFDLRAAIELSLFTDAKLSRGDKKQGIAATWAKIKFDRQIVAIAKVLRATCIYSDDKGLQATARREDVSVFGIADISMPDKDAGDFRLTPPKQSDPRK